MSGPLMLVLGMFAATCATLSAAETQPAAAPVERPTIPGKTFAVTDFGGVADGKTLNSGAIQKAIEACTQAGGGTVTIPSGTFLTGPVMLASNLNLHLDKGAVLQLSTNVADFPEKQPRDALAARNLHDVSITGEGTIDGNGGAWRPVAGKPAGGAAVNAGRRPMLVFAFNCARVLVQDVTFVNSPSMNVVALDCQNVTIEHVTVKAPETAVNTDGVDVSGKNILIARSSFDVGDDDIRIQPGTAGKPDAPECDNITISDCTLLHGKGIVVGNQTTGCLRNLRVANCTFDGTQYGLRMRTDRARGGTVQDVSYDNITMNNVKFPIYFSSYFPIYPKTAGNDPAQAVSPTTPVWKNIRISKLTAAGSMTAGSIVGLPEQPIDGVTLTEVNISATRSMEVTHARNVTFNDAHISVDKGKPVVVQDAQATGLEGLSAPSEALP